jgi:hypothetical protein
LEAIMTIREHIEGWAFGALFVVGLPALIFLSQRMAG